MTAKVIIIIAVVLVLGLLVIPFINKVQFKKMPLEQKVRVLMKQAKGLAYFKNISNGTKGSLIYIKNKRKIYIYDWALSDGKMICTNEVLFDKWYYPSENNIFSDDEKELALKDLEQFNKKNFVKLVINYDD
ncbi:MAG: hypothetical protein IJT65_03990 [Eubacterium sp.]|nr:hypothetical protein [Eubacterium sp.]